MKRIVPEIVEFLDRFKDDLYFNAMQAELETAFLKCEAELRAGDVIIRNRWQRDIILKWVSKGYMHPDAYHYFYNYSNVYTSRDAAYRLAYTVRNATPVHQYVEAVLQAIEDAACNGKIECTVRFSDITSLEFEALQGRLMMVGHRFSEVDNKTLLIKFL